MVAVALAPVCTDTATGVAESLNDGAAGIELSASISGWPAGVPHPVARSKPPIAAKPLLPDVMSCRAVL